LLLTPFGDGMCGSSPTLEAIMLSSTPAPSASAQRTSSPISITASLLSELQHADAIIKAMLNALTAEQKVKVHAQLDAAGVSGEGMVRANERRAVIEAASATQHVLLANVIADQAADKLTSMPTRNSLHNTNFR
jgi:hypothetical protein